MTKDITTKSPSGEFQAPVQSDQTFALLQQAVQAGTSPESLEKLVALQERILARNAEAEFTSAMSEFQARCPAIAKRHEVKDRGGRLMYKFAPLEDVVDQIRELLAELGLSYSFDTTQDERGIEVTCIIRHRAGHHERTKVQVPTTQGHNTNAAQNMAIQLTYGKRYALIGALGIVTADSDQDGVTQTLRPITPEQVADLTTLMIEVEADTARFLKYLGVTSMEDIPARDYDRAVAALEAKRAKK
jgi:hypothetical protein